MIEDWTGHAGHVHDEDDEAWLVLEGVLVIRVGDEEVRARPGETDWGAYASELL